MSGNCTHFDIFIDCYCRQLYVFGQFFNPIYAAGLGAVYIVARFVYRAAYMKDPSGRGAGFSIGFLATVAMVLGGLVGAVMKLL